jgi:predicted ArsR family transcriptional regulator
LTESGHEIFPRQYAWLSNTLLEVLSERLGGAETAVLMRQLADHVSGPLEERIARLPDGPRRYTEIAAIMTELGYRALLKQSDARKGVVIEATNCVYHSVAKQHPELCQFDIALIQNMSKNRVRLESCIARGGSVCRFCIKGKEPTEAD